jgi:hypothetical protein
MNQVLNRSAREFSAAATEGLAKPQNEQALGPSSSPRAPMQNSPQAAPLQAGALETRPDASTAPATGGSLPAQGKAEVDASHLASFGLQSAAPAFTPAALNQAPALAPSVRIGPDGAPIATAPSTPALTDSVHPAETPKQAAAAAASQTVKPDAAPVAATPSNPASTVSAHQPGTPKPAAAAPALQTVRPNAAPIATTPSTPSSTVSARPPETPKPAAAAAALQTVKPDAAPIEKASSASTASAPLTETPKPKAPPIAHASNETKQPSTPKADSKKKPIENASLQKPLRSPTPPVKSIAQAERQSAAPTQPKEAARSPEPPQGAGNPAQVAPVAAPSVQQRFADGMTHAFGSLMHLPGALVPHRADPNADH